jgi:hypothetical protein
MAEKRAQQNAADRVERESGIETPEAAAKKRRSATTDLPSLFADAAAYFLIHDMPQRGKLGKGPNCVIDYGTHIYIPRNASEGHFRQVADLVRAKGWNSVAVFRPNGHSIHQKVSGAIQQVAPHLNVCTDRSQVGSSYKCRVETIHHHNAMKAMHP